MIREYKKNGLELPNDVRNKPELIPHFSFYLDAFFEISSDRQIGFGLGPIPFTAISEFAKMAGIPKDSFFSFLTIIRKLDIEYRRLMESKQNGGNTT